MSTRDKIEKLEELVKDRINGELVEQTVESLVAPGENFGSVIYKVDFKVKNGEKVDIHHAVAKCTPPNKVSQELFNIKVTFKSEIAWYTTVIPTIQDFQREHGVKQVADFFQSFYGARISLDPNSDEVDIDAVLFTENLNTLGYKNVDRHIGFDLNTSKAILRDLATFHAVPLAIKLENKELFDKNIKPYLPGIQFKADPNRDQFKNIKDQLKEISEVAPYMDRVAANLDKNKSSSNSPLVTEPWGTVCHFDFWINNIMVKEGDNPKTIFLDFQMPVYGPAASDVLFFLITSVELKVIKAHIDELIRYYWNEFLKNLKQLNISDSSFTYEAFLKQIDEAARNGQFAHVLFRTCTIMADKGHTDFDSSDENFEAKDFKPFSLAFNERHKEKFKWLVLEFVRRNWI